MDAIFLFKKALSALLEPISIVIGMVLVGLVLVHASRRWLKNASHRRRLLADRLGMGTVLLAAILLYLASISPVSGWLTRSLESRHPPLPERGGQVVVPGKPAWIVVLAGGHRAGKGKPALSRLSPPSFARVVGGVALHRQFPDAGMVFTGHPRETGSMRLLAERLGVPGDAIVEESESRDTKDHPIFVGEVVGEDPFLLVTSATHMPRSAALFRGAGLDPVLAPVDFVAWPDDGWGDAAGGRTWVPLAQNLNKTAVAMHEYLGLAWARLRGQTAVPAPSGGAHGSEIR